MGTVDARLALRVGCRTQTELYVLDLVHNQADPFSGESGSLCSSSTSTHLYVGWLDLCA